mgnify:CR=1 FL=1
MKKAILLLSLSLLTFVACDNNTTPGETPEQTDPTLTITSDTLYNIGAEGGEFEITYTLENPTEDGIIETIVNQNWISIVENDENGTINCSVAENLSTESRTAAITVTYLEISKTVQVIQEGSTTNESEFDVEYDAQMMWGVYYGDRYDINSANYWIVFSFDGLDDMGNIYPDSEYYRVDLYGPVASDLSNIVVADGTYSFDTTNSLEQFTMTAENSSYITTDGERNPTVIPFEDAQMTVNGNEMILIATINGEKHKVTFNGSYTFQDLSPKDYGSTLKDDLVADLSNHQAYVSAYGDYWGCGYCNWWIEILPDNEDQSGDSFIFDFHTDSLTPTDDISGIYPSSGFSADDPTKPNFGPDSFVPGMVISAEGHLMGSLYLEYTSGQLTNQAPLIDGYFEVIDNGNGTHTINIETYDDSPLKNKITATWTGYLIW